MWNPFKRAPKLPDPDTFRSRALAALEALEDERRVAARQEHISTELRKRMVAMADGVKDAREAIEALVE